MFKIPRLDSILKSIFPCKYVKIKKVKKNRFVSRVYCDLISKIESKRDERGWVLDDCDAMLYQGLFEACAKNSFPLQYAEDRKHRGKFYRTSEQCCYKDKKSASEWSKDMGIGLMYWCLRNGNKRALNDHFKYGQKNKWVMGRGPISRTFYTPSYISLLDQVRHKLNGKKYPDYKKRLAPQIYNSGLSGYQAHLQVLAIALEGELYGKIPKEAFKRLKEHNSRKPWNPLFAAVYARFKGGNIDFAINAIKSPLIDDYDGGVGAKTKHDIDTVFAANYLHR